MKIKIVSISIAFLFFLFWPIIVWNSKIEFDYTQFVNEWLKAICSGIILVFLFNFSFNKISKGNNLLQDKKKIEEIKILLETISTLISEKKDNDINYYWEMTKYKLETNLLTSSYNEKIFSIRCNSRFCSLQTYLNDRHYVNDGYVDDILNTIKQIILELNEC